MKIPLLCLVGAFAYLGVGLLVGDYVKVKQQVAYINAERQPDRAVQDKQDGKQGSVNTQKVSRPDSEHGQQNTPQTYVLGMELANALLVLLTAAIACFTLGILREEIDRSRKELRAYVAMEDIFFVYKWPNAMETGEKERSDNLKVRIKNYGQTPAHNVRIQIGRIKEPPPPGFEPSHFPYQVGDQMLHPGQRVGGDRPQDGDFVSSKPGFCIYGRVDYQDIYRRWWVTKFCFRFGMEPGRKYDFTPYGDYNREEGHYMERPAV